MLAAEEMTMKNASLKEITLKLPKGVADDISAQDIVGMYRDKAVTMTEYYRSRCREFEGKYGMVFNAFKKKVESAKKEKMSEWDDLIVWEGFELAYSEWKNKSKELRKCCA